MRESRALAVLRSSCLALLLLACPELAFPERVRAFGLVRVADLNTPIPEGIGNFTFLWEFELSGRNVAFLGSGASGQEGIYLFNGASVARVADQNTPIPHGSGTFTGFSAPVLSGGNVAFRATGASGQEGIYLFNGTSLTRMADLTTAIPDGSGDIFTSVGGPLLSGGNVAFRGTGASGQEGIYLFNGTALARVADRYTLVPSGIGTFRGFSGVALSGSNLALEGLSGGEPLFPGFFEDEGIYFFNGANLVRVADLMTAIPDGNGTFASQSFYPRPPNAFSGPVLSEGNVAFLGRGSGQEGIYLFDGASLMRIADRATAIPNGSGTFTRFSPPMLSGRNVAFAHANSGIYLFNGTTLLRVADQATPLPDASGTVGFLSFFAVSGENVAFVSGALGEGIYLFNGTDLARVADVTTPIPDGSGTFEFFTAIALSGRYVAFRGFAAPGNSGIYLATPSDWPGLTAVGPARLWLGLRNSDDIGTAFDVRVELYQNATLVTAGLTRCVRGLTRAPGRAQEIEVAFNGVPPVELAGGDVLSFRVLTRVGTNADDTRCTGSGATHGGATGLRLYYDAAGQPSHFDTTIGDEAADVFLHSDGGACITAPSAGVTIHVLDNTIPTSVSAKCADSRAVSFPGGNAWTEIATWSMAPVP
jgi:hypothetical protein